MCLGGRVVQLGDFAIVTIALVFLTPKGKLNFILKGTTIASAAHKYRWRGISSRSPRGAAKGRAPQPVTFVSFEPIRYLILYVEPLSTELLSATVVSIVWTTHLIFKGISEFCVASKVSDYIISHFSGYWCQYCYGNISVHKRNSVLASGTTFTVKMM